MNTFNLMLATRNERRYIVYVQMKLGRGKWKPAGKYSVRYRHTSCRLWGECPLSGDQVRHLLSFSKMGEKVVLSIDGISYRIERVEE